MFLCANKVDLIQEKEDLGELSEIQTQEGIEYFAQDLGFAGAFRTSAKDDIMITPMMAQLTRQMLIKELTEQAEADEAEANELKQQNPNIRIGLAHQPRENDQLNTSRKGKSEKGCC